MRNRKNKMNVLIISPCDLPVPAVKGGAVATLVESLAIQNEKYQKINLTVLGNYDRDALEKSKKYKNTNFIFLKEPKLCTFFDNIYELLYSKILNREHTSLKRYAFKLYAIEMFSKILRKQDYDCIVFQNSGYLLNVLRNKKVLEKYRGKIYYHVHNDIPYNINVNGLKECQILVISEYLKKRILEIAGQEVRSQFKILKNGIDCRQFNQKLSLEEKKKFRKNIGIGEEDKVIVFAGRIVPGKGIAELVEAYRELNLENTILLVVGSHNFGTTQTSTFEIKMKKIFEELGDRIKFTGYIPYCDMWKYYKMSDLAVLPSMCEEAAGLTIIEATASGIPVITTRSGGIPEYVNEDFVYFVERNESVVGEIKTAICDVLGNYDEWKIKASNASKFVSENYSEEKYYMNFLNVIDV